MSGVMSNLQYFNSPTKSSSGRPVRLINGLGSDSGKVLIMATGPCLSKRLARKNIPGHVLLREEAEGTMPMNLGSSILAGNGVRSMSSGLNGTPIAFSNMSHRECTIAFTPTSPTCCRSRKKGLTLDPVYSDAQEVMPGKCIKKSWYASWATKQMGEFVCFDKPLVMMAHNKISPSPPSRLMYMVSDDSRSNRLNSGVGV